MVMQRQTKGTNTLPGMRSARKRKVSLSKFVSGDKMGENPENAKKLRDLKVSSDFLMLVGAIWCAFGIRFFEFYWILGGTLLFIMGIMTLPAPKRG